MQLFYRKEIAIICQLKQQKKINSCNTSEGFDFVEVPEDEIELISQCIYSKKHQMLLHFSLECL